MTTARCRSVTIEGMRVPVENVIVELRLPTGSLHAGELVGWEASTAAVMDAREIGDPGFRVTQADPFGLPRAENPADWENSEESLETRLDSEADRLTDFEKKVLLRGTPLGHGRYTFLLTLGPSDKPGRPSVSVAELKKLQRFSPRALVFTEPVSAGRAGLPGTDDLDYRSVLGAPVTFDAKKARGAAGRQRNRPGKPWEAARRNPEVLAMLLRGISPGSSETPSRVKGTRRANAWQMAWVLRSPGGADVLSQMLRDAEETLDAWVTDSDIATATQEIAEGTDPRHFESLFDRYDYQQDELDVALRIVRGFADLADVEPETLVEFLGGKADADTGQRTGPSPDMLTKAEALGYVSTEQAEKVRLLTAETATSANPAPAAGKTAWLRAWARQHKPELADLYDRMPPRFTATHVVPASFLDGQLPILRSLELPAGRAAVSGSLVFVGVPGIEPGDIDVLCDQETWHAYSLDPRAAWRTTKTGIRTFSINGAEFFTDLPGMLSTAAPSLPEALSTSETRWGVPFVSVSCMRAWKLRVGREKDIRHVRLLDLFVTAGGVLPGR